jgi:ribosomal protein S18 acetylase RimI-like enzyme
VVNPPQNKSLVIKSFQWKDLDILLGLENQLRMTDGESGSITKRLLAEQLRQPNLDIERDLLLCIQNNQLRATSLICHEPRINRAILDIKGTEEFLVSKFVDDLLIAALEKARILKVSTLDFLPPPQISTETLTDKWGFYREHTYLKMRWIPRDLSNSTFPVGYSIRNYHDGGDAQALTNIQNASFDGSFNFSPNSLEEIHYRANMSNTSYAGIIFLMHGDTIAGYNWTLTNPIVDGTKGIISMIGIHPSCRGQGLGKPLLVAGLKHLVSIGTSFIELEVDEANEAAIRLYRSIGFESSHRLYWFHLPIRSQTQSLPNDP